MASVGEGIAPLAYRLLAPTSATGAVRCGHPILPLSKRRALFRSCRDPSACRPASYRRDIPSPLLAVIDRRGKDLMEGVKAHDFGLTWGERTVGTAGRALLPAVRPAPPERSLAAASEALGQSLVARALMLVTPYVVVAPSARSESYR